MSPDVWAIGADAEPGIPGFEVLLRLYFQIMSLVAMVRIFTIPRGPCVKGVDPRFVPLGGGRTFKSRAK